MLHGLVGGQGHKSVILSEVLTIVVVMMIGFRWREIRGVGVAIVVPMLTVCRKLAMRLFCGGKKWSTMGYHHGLGVSILPYSR